MLGGKSDFVYKRRNGRSLGRGTQEMIYNMTVAPFNYTKAKGKWFFDGQVMYIRKCQRDYMQRKRNAILI